MDEGGIPLKTWSGRSVVFIPFQRTVLSFDFSCQPQKPQKHYEVWVVMFAKVTVLYYNSYVVLSASCINLILTKYYFIKLVQ